MEHEVFIPVPAETLREALRDHARVARCVPGLQQDADESARPLSGRLKVRVGGHTITYRGALTLTERAGVFTAKGEGSEVRGTGSAKLNVRVRLRETAGGTTVAFTATSTSQGRLAETDTTTSESTARRLLDRFTTALGKPQPDAGAVGGVPAAGAGDLAGADPDVSVSDTSGRAAEGATGGGSERDASAAGAAGLNGEATSGAGPDRDGPDAGAAVGGVPAAGAGDSGDPDVSVSDTSGRAAEGATGAGSDRDTSAAGAAGLNGEADDSAGRTGEATPGAGPDRDATASEATPGAGPDTSGRAPDGAAGSAASEHVEAAAGDSAGSDRDASAEGAAGSDPGVPVSGADGDKDGDVADPGADDSAPQDPETAPDPDVPDPGAHDAPVPPSAIDASAGFGATASGDGDFLVPLDPPAEAAHARRTMIGRSAEEVDHAPPRGRYAPEQAPDSGGAGAALRWVAPAAALAIAGAVVVGRALRRRR